LFRTPIRTELPQVVCWFEDLTSRTQKRKPSGTGGLISKSQKVLRVLRQVFSCGRYRQQFGIHASTADFV